MRLAEAKGRTTLIRKRQDHALLAHLDRLPAAQKPEVFPPHVLSSAQKGFGDLIALAAQGQQQVLLRNTTPVAVLLPADAGALSSDPAANTGAASAGGAANSRGNQDRGSAPRRLATLGDAIGSVLASGPTSGATFGLPGLANKGAGFTKPPTSSTPCQRPRSPARKGHPGHLQRGGPRPRRGSGQGVCQALQCEVPQGRQEDHRGRARAAGVLRLPGRALVHLGTTNLIESTFSTVRLRTKVTRGVGSRTAALAMVFKLVEAAQQRWRAVNAPHLVALVRTGARFEGGPFVERPDDRLQAEAA